MNLADVFCGWQYGGSLAQGANFMCTNCPGGTTVVEYGLNLTISGGGEETYYAQALVSRQ